MVLKQFTPGASVFTLEFGNAHLHRLSLVCSHPWDPGCPASCDCNYWCNLFFLSGPLPTHCIIRHSLNSHFHSLPKIFFSASSWSFLNSVPHSFCLSSQNIVFPPKRTWHFASHYGLYNPCPLSLPMQTSYGVYSCCYQTSPILKDLSTALVVVLMQLLQYFQGSDGGSRQSLSPLICCCSLGFPVCLGRDDSSACYLWREGEEKEWRYQMPDEILLGQLALSLRTWSVVLLHGNCWFARLLYSVSGCLAFSGFSYLTVLLPKLGLWRNLFFLLKAWFTVFDKN